MRKRFFIGIVVFCGVVYFSGLFDVIKFVIRMNSKERGQMTESQFIPESNFTLLDGGSVSTSKFKDKAVIVHFWATWCHPCVEEFPALLSFAKKLDPSVVLVLVSSDFTKDDLDEYLEGVEKNNPDYKQVLKKDNVFFSIDLEGDITATQYGVYGFPETFFFNKSHILDQKIIGPLDFDNIQSNIIQSLISE